jgi:hypothetical protein
LFVFAKNKYTNPDFGKTFFKKVEQAEHKLKALQPGFELCANVCQADTLFMKSIVFPEVMRFNAIKDGIEAESLRTLYVQFGEDYANFSIGLFQMKPSFAEQIEIKSKSLLPDSLDKELQLSYAESTNELIRRSRVNRLEDEDWQLVYLSAFIAICNELYKHKQFKSDVEKLQWYATLYNAGFEKSEAYIANIIDQHNFYLEEGMPEKKFKYAAVAAWYYLKNK